MSKSFPPPRPMRSLAWGVAIVAVTGLLWGCSSTNASTQSIHPPGLEGIIQSPLQPKPNFTLTDTSGQPYNFQQQTAGDVTLLYFGYTHCPDICPTQMADMAIGLSKVSPSVRSQVKVVFVTTDPNRDTPAVLRDWLDAFNPSFIGLTGTVAQITAAEATVGMPPATVEPIPGTTNYSVDHAAWVIAFTKDNYAHAIYPAGITASVWSHDLPRLVKEWQ